MTVFEESVHEVATLSKETIDLTDTLWNALLGESEITIHNFNTVVESGVLDRLIGYMQRKWSSPKQEENKVDKDNEEEDNEENNKDDNLVLETTQETSAVANLVEKNAVSFSKTLIDSTEKIVALIPTLYDDEPIEDVFFLGEQKVLDTVEATENAIGNSLKYTYGYFTSILNNAKKNPTERIGEESTMGMYEGTMQGPLDVEKLYDDAKETLLSPVYGIATTVKDIITSSSVWKMVQAGTNFFYIFCALVLLGKFDFLLENTYALALIAILLVYFLNTN